MKTDPHNTDFESSGFTTKILHAAITRDNPHGAVHAAIQPSVTYTYEKVEDLIDVFQGKQAGFSYARANSPTVATLEKRISLLEKGVDTLCLATGMAGILLPIMALAQKGDHILTSKYLFGNTVNLFHTLKRVGLDLDFVDICDIHAIEAKIKPQTKFLFFETISNPLTYIPDLENISALAKEHGIITIADNTVTTPYLFTPKKLGFSLSHQSLTKYISGHSAALGGAITDLGVEDWSRHSCILEQYRDKQPSPVIRQLRKKGMRDMGSTLSPHAAATLALGMETMVLRMQRICDSSEKIALFLSTHPCVARVYHPSLPDHPHHERMKKWYRRGSGILAFELKPERNLITMMNALQIFRRATHLGDTRSLAIPVAPTIFFDAGAEGRRELGISEHLIRLSIGIEECDDLLNDLAHALKQA